MTRERSNIEPMPESPTRDKLQKGEAARAVGAITLAATYGLLAAAGLITGAVLRGTGQWLTDKSRNLQKARDQKKHARTDTTPTSMLDAFGADEWD